MLNYVLDFFGWTSRAPAGINGLASFAFLVVPLLMLSIGAVRWGRAYRLHQYFQTLLGLVLAVALIGFEWQVRGEGWRIYAQDSKYADTWVMPALIFHLCFALPTFVIWVLVLYHSWKNFTLRARPGKYSMIHKRLGRIAAIMMGGTAASGWLFYWLAFVN